MAHKHILYVITDLELGGVPLHLHRLALAMRERGFTPRVVSLAGCGPVAESMAKNGIEVQSCEGSGGWDVRVLVRLTRIMRASEPDLVHSFLFHANLAARLAAWEAGVPSDRVICEIQTVEKERLWHLTVARWTQGGCKFTIGNSPSVVEHLASRGGIKRDRLRLIRGGIDAVPLREALPAGRSALGLPEESSIVLWTGRLDPVKGLATLVDSFVDVATANKNAYLLLVGSGPLREQLSRQIAGLNMTKRVLMLGARDDVPALLKAADVFVLPSRTEGLPNSLLEAMASPCAVVATDVPGCRDLVAHEQTGLLVPYGDTSVLSAAIRRLLDDGKLANQLARSAGDLVERSWRIEDTYAEYANTYEELLAAS